MRLAPADSLDLDELVELFNEAYSDYVVSLRLDRAGIGFMLDVIDADLAASRVAFDDEKPVALAFLARRGDEGWIAGMGTVPSHRRRGIGEDVLSAVIDEAQARGLRNLRLEVINSNAPARLLYEKLGFRRLRDLVVWMLEGAPPHPSRACPAESAEVEEWIASRRRTPEPWQRAAETLARMRARGLPFEALVVEQNGTREGAVLYQIGMGVPRVGQIAAEDDDIAVELLSAVAARGEGFRFLNAPADEPSCRACERLGARVEARQHEMQLDL